jgi:hypothetical protein
MPIRMTTMQRIAIGMLLAGFVLSIATAAAVMDQISQLVPYSNVPPPDLTLYERMWYFSWVLIGGGFAILFVEAWRTKGRAWIWDSMTPKTRLQKFGFGLTMAGLIMATPTNFRPGSPFGNIVMLVGISLWQGSFATKKDPAKS